MRDRYLLPLALFAALSFGATPATALTLDTFSTSLPPNPCLPVTGQPVVFLGPFCDGAACPPDAFAACVGPSASQSGAAGVYAGTRRDVIVHNWLDEPTRAFVDPATHTLRADFGGVSESLVDVFYGTPFDATPAADALNLDLVTLGGSEFRFLVDGDFSDANPIGIEVIVLSDAAVTPRPSATARITLDTPGIVSIPFVEFVPDLGFTFADVDDIQITLSNCTNFDSGCGDREVPPLHLAIGPIDIVTAPVATVRTSWGRLMALYR